MRITNNNLPSGILAGVKPISFARGGVVYRQAGTYDTRNINPETGGTREADLYDPSNILGWIPDRFIEQIKSGLIPMEADPRQYPVEGPEELTPAEERMPGGPFDRRGVKWITPKTQSEFEFHSQLLDAVTKQEVAERAGEGIAKVGGALYDAAGEVLETGVEGALTGIAQLERLPDIEVPDISGGVTSLIERGGDWLENDFVPSVKEGAASVLQSLKNRGYVPESMTKGDLESFLMQAGIRMEELKDQGIGVIRNIGASIEEAGGLMPLLQQQFDYSGRMAALGGEEPGQIPQPPVGGATEEQIEAEILTDTGPSIPGVIGADPGPEDPYGYGAAAADIDVEAEAARMAKSIEKTVPDDTERFTGRVGTWFGNLNTRLKEDPEFRRAFIAGAARMGEGAEGPVPVSLTGQFMRGFGEEQARQAAAKPELVKTIEMLTEMYPGMTPESILKLMSPRSSYGEPNLLLQMRENATDIGKGSVNESLLKTQILGDNFVLVEEGGKEKLDVNTLNRILNSMDRLGIETEFDLVDYLLKKGYIQSTYGVEETTGAGGKGPEESLGQRIKKAFTRTPEQEQMDAYKR